MANNQPKPRSRLGELTCGCALLLIRAMSSTRGPCGRSLGHCRSWRLPVLTLSQGLGPKLIDSPRTSVVDHQHGA